jgi:antirestriction protein ArdC
MYGNQKARGLAAEIEASVRRLAQETDAQRREQEVATYLAAMGRFHRYSVGNRILIGMQRPEATYVAGYRTWQELGRQVRRGEKGILILVPYRVKPRRRDGEEGEEEQPEPEVLRFGTGYVFDVAQTDGEPLPATPEYRPEARDEELQRWLLAAAREELGLAVVEGVAGEKMAGAWGVTNGSGIALREDAGTAVLAHEMAHAVLHAGIASFGDEQRLELEAEATSYAVLSHYGQNPGTAARYIALWEGDAKAVLARLGRVAEGAARIIEAVERVRARENAG